jgi:hypothetical protein
VSLELEADGLKIRSIDSLPYEAEINLTDGPHKLIVRGKDKDGHESSHDIRIGVNTAWDAGASSTP